jgi:hypothetical protein
MTNSAIDLNAHVLVAPFPSRFADLDPAELDIACGSDLMVSRDLVTFTAVVVATSVPDTWAIDQVDQVRLRADSPPVSLWGRAGSRASDRSMHIDLPVAPYLSGGPVVFWVSRLTLAESAVATRREATPVPRGWTLYAQLGFRGLFRSRPVAQRLHHTGSLEVPKMTTWQKPEFTDVSMNAEIGSYQEDTGGGGNVPPARKEADAQRDQKAR